MVLVFGLATIDQPAPSQDSTRVCQAPPTTYSPTAVQAVRETHDTAFRTLELLLAFWLGTTDHSLPSHTSLNVWSDDPLAYHPTARQSLSETHETDRSSLV